MSTVLTQEEVLEEGRLKKIYDTIVAPCFDSLAITQRVIRNLNKSLETTF